MESTVGKIADVLDFNGLQINHLSILKQLLHIPVENAQAWYEHVNKLIESGDFPNARVAPPKLQEHGDIVTYVWDPSGILLHFAETPAK